MEEKNHIDEYDGSNDEYTLCTNGVFPIGNTWRKNSKN